MGTVAITFPKTMHSSSALLIFTALLALTAGKKYPEDCSDASQGGGSCVPIKSCSSVIDMVKQAVKNEMEGNLAEKKVIVAAIRKRVCGELKQKKICCKDDDAEELVPRRQSPVEELEKIEVVTEAAKTTEETTEPVTSVEEVGTQTEEPVLTLTPIGDFVNHVHGVGGSVFARGHNTVVIKGFTYDGKGPDAFLWAGNSSKPDEEALEEGFVNAVLPHSLEGGLRPSYEYKDEDIPILGSFLEATDIEVKLPGHVSVEELRWISVWCRKFGVNFGHVDFPDSFRLN